MPPRLIGKSHSLTLRSETSFGNNRSAEIAPSTSFPILIGTQMNAMSFLRSPDRAPVRLRNRGSWETRGTTAGLPLWITFPVTPSPSRYRPFSF